MRGIEICAGAGGLGYGLSLAGFDVLGVERDADAVSTHCAHAGPCVLADVNSWHAPHSAALVAGGIPCQPFSSAGRQFGLADERGQLWRQLLRIADEASARALLIENVRGLATTRGPDGTTALRFLLEQITQRGWFATHQVLDAADFGVPQHRDRIFIVGFREESAARKFRWPDPTHGPRDNLLGLPRYVSVRDALGLPGTDELTVLDRPANCVLATDSYVQRDAGTLLRRHVDELAAAGLLDRPATTVSAVAGGRVPAAGHHDRQMAGAVRLGTAQLAILQGFPRDWQFAGNRVSRCRQIGNAVPPPLARAVGGALLSALRGDP